MYQVVDYVMASRAEHALLLIKQHPLDSAIYSTPDIIHQAPLDEFWFAPQPPCPRPLRRLHVLFVPIIALYAVMSPPSRQYASSSKARPDDYYAARSVKLTHPWFFGFLLLG
jgi:hypothetical protein